MSQHTERILLTIGALIASSWLVVVAVYGAQDPNPLWLFGTQTLIAFVAAVVTGRNATPIVGFIVGPSLILTLLIGVIATSADYNLALLLPIEQALVMVLLMPLAELAAITARTVRGRVRGS